MGRKGRRNTAKTGDRAVYRAKAAASASASRAESSSSSRLRGRTNDRYDVGNNDDDDDDNDDPMYNEVDRFHNARDKDFLKLESRHGEDDEEEDDDEDEAVMNLAIGGDDSEDDSSVEESEVDDDEDDNDKRRHQQRQQQQQQQHPSGKKGERGREDTRPLSSSASSSSSENDDDDTDDSYVETIEQQRNRMKDDDDVRDWGKKKSAYYHGDTADLEIGQDEEDAYLEEEAAKEVQAARYKEMSEEDFVLSDDDNEDQEGNEGKEHRAGNKGKLGKGKVGDDRNDGSSSTTPAVTAKATTFATRRDPMQLSTREKRKILDRQHPELLPLMCHFATAVKEFNGSTSVAARALFEGEAGTAEAVGATRLGQQYLLTKALLQSSTALNLAMYLLLKSEQQEGKDDENDDDKHDDDVLAGSSSSSLAMQSHPVLSRLEKWNTFAQKLETRVEDKIPGLSGQIENLAKASKLMTAESEAANNNHNDDDDDKSASGDDDGDDDDDKSASGDDDHDDDDDKIASGDDDDNNNSRTSAEPASAGTAQEGPQTRDEESMKQRRQRRNVLNEARFGLRSNEISSSGSGRDSQVNNARKRSTTTVSAAAAEEGTFDFGDEDLGDGDDVGDDGHEITGGRRNKDTASAASRSLSTTLNSIEQRYAVAAAKKRRAEAPFNGDRIDDTPREHENDDGNELRQGLQMMEEEMGKDFDEVSSDGGGAGAAAAASGGNRKRTGEEATAAGDDENDDGDDFYAQVKKKSQSRKRDRKSMYQVAPKFPRVEAEIDGERAISKTIMKNRGLVAHKSKLNRNPRVKKREQYRKALIRRKGAVREVRTNEGHKYGGEGTGIKSGLSRSRKLAG